MLQDVADSCADPETVDPQANLPCGLVAAIPCGAIHRAGTYGDSMTQPFAGIRVVEFGQFVAVPFCGQTLAEGGAEIIKVEPTDGDPNRRMGQLAPGESRIFICRNRGKHSLPLKLNDPQSKPVIDALVAWADVVLTNFRPGLATELGLDAEQLRARYPRLIVGDITPFGKQGPDADLAAMDIVVQARSGLMAAIGRTVDGRPAPGDPVIADYMAAMTLAFGIASALFRRERTGAGGIVDVSLLEAAMVLTNNQLVRSEDHDRGRHQARIERLNEQRRAGVPFAEQAAGLPSARVLPLRAIYFRTYDTADGTIAIGCASKALQQRFIEVVGFSDRGLDSVDGLDWEDDYYTALRDEVEGIMRTRRAADWVRLLNARGVPVSTVKFPIEMFEDEQAEANGMFYILDHPTAGRFRVLAPPLALDGGGFLPAKATAPFGSEATAILERLGFSAAQIEGLVSRGVTRVGLDG